MFYIRDVFALPSRPAFWWCNRTCQIFALPLHSRYSRTFPQFFGSSFTTYFFGSAHIIPC